MSLQWPFDGVVTECVVPPVLVPAVSHSERIGESPYQITFERLSPPSATKSHQFVGYLFHDRIVHFVSSIFFLIMKINIINRNKMKRRRIFRMSINRRVLIFSVWKYWYFHIVENTSNIRLRWLLGGSNTSKVRPKHEQRRKVTATCSMSYVTKSYAKKRYRMPQIYPET